MSELSPIEPDEFRTVARRIGAAIREADGLGWKEAEQKFLALEPELVGLFQAEVDRQEVRRRIREVIVTHLSLAEPAPDGEAFDVHWQRMLELGFSTEERRMSMQFFRLSYAIDTAVEGIDVEAELARFGEDAEGLSRIDTKLGEHFREAHQRLGARLRRGTS